MLHIIDPEREKHPTVELKEILNHRLDYLNSEKIPVNDETVRDIFDVPQTTYLAYQDDSYGVIGSARLDPFTLLLCSTNAADYQALEEKTQSGMSVADAVAAVLEERKKG